LPAGIAGDLAREETTPLETLRLRRIQLPHVGRLLDAYIARSAILPKGAYQIRDPASLPAGLRPILKEATGQGRVWSCWTNGADNWLFTCQMSLPLSRQRGTPVLHVSVYDGEGALRDSANWAADPRGPWRRLEEDQP
jgi:hypothetical protein